MGPEHKILCLRQTPRYHILWCLEAAAKLSKGYGVNFRSVASWGRGEGRGLRCLRSVFPLRLSLVPQEVGAPLPVQFLAHPQLAWQNTVEGLSAFGICLSTSLPILATM